MNYFPFHIGDNASATRHLSWDEDMAYRRLLDIYYTTEKPLPAEMRSVFRLVVASTDAQREAVQTVLEEFFILTDEGWRNERADREIVAMQEKQQKQRDKANKRWHKPEAEPGNAPAMPQHVSGDATASQEDANALPPTPTPTPTPTPNSSVVVGLPPTTDPAPHSEILALWAEVIPEAVQPAQWTESRKQALRARWRESAKRQNLDYWRRLFTYIRDSDFLMGKEASQGRRPFAISLDWLLKQENFLKVIEGKFHTQKEQA